MYFYIALVAWLVGVMVSYREGRRRLPMVIFCAGAVLVILSYAGKAGFWGLPGLAILALIIWVANQIDAR